MKKRSVGVVVVALFIAFAMSACGGGTDAEPKKNGSEVSEKPKRNTDPSKGWVKVFTQFGYYGPRDDMVVSKRCNGQNLVYVTYLPKGDYANGGISVIPDSDQCRKR